MSTAEAEVDFVLVVVYVDVELANLSTHENQKKGEPADDREY